MNIFKRVLILLLIASTMEFSMVACGTSKESSSSIEESSSYTTQETFSITEIETENTSSNDVFQVDLNAIVDEITSKIEWASLTTIEDEELISEFFTLDANNSNYRQLLVKQCPMSAVISEIILIQSNDVQSAMEDLQTRKQKLIDVDAYYPEHKEIAENSIVGSYGDIAYFIASETAEESETVLREYLDGLDK